MQDEIRIISIDAGNKDIKAVLGDLNNKLSFPNVLCPLPEARDLVENDEYFGSLNSQLNNLHFRVRSSVLGADFNNKVFGAGSLAMKNKKAKMEVPERVSKATNDQILVMYLLTAALDAVNNYEPDQMGIIHYEAVLSAFLPVVDVRKGLKARFQQRLEDGNHEIQFLQVPGAENVKVKIKFVRTYISTEGVAALVDLAIPESSNYHIADPTLLRKKVLVNEIGGGTTEQPIVDRGRLDKDNSGGIRIGTSAYLDEIIQEIEDRYEHEVSSREKLVEYIKDDYKPYQLKIKGAYRSFKSIADRQLRSCANKIYERVDYLWKNVDDLDLTLNIGGGSLLLKDHLKRANARNEYPEKFINDEQLVPFLNARGGWKSVQRKEAKLLRPAVM